MAKEQLKKRPWCPFCGQTVGRPTEAPARKMTEFPVGTCQCGAVYTCDATGHNVGAAMVEALVYACGDNWDLAWELMPEDDYLTGRIENYDETLHQVVEMKNIDGRYVRGVLYFVRLHTEMSELARRLKEKKEHQVAESATVGKIQPPVIEPAPVKDRVRQKATKQAVRAMVERSDSDGLVALCFDDKKTLRLMQRLLYDPDEEKRWKTAWMIGQVGARVASRDPGQVSELLHRLFEACSDSAATPWGMVETIGYVIAERPDIFGAFTRYLLRYIGEQSTQIQVVWAMGEIARTRPDLIRETPFFNLFHFLQHPDPQVRGLVSRLLGRIKATEAALQLMVLRDDNAGLIVRENGKACTTTVAAEAAMAISAIHGGKEA